MYTCNPRDIRVTSHSVLERPRVTEGSCLLASARFVTHGCDLSNICEQVIESDYIFAAVMILRLFFDRLYSTSSRVGLCWSLLDCVVPANWLRKCILLDFCEVHACHLCLVKCWITPQSSHSVRIISAGLQLRCLTVNPLIIISCMKLFLDVQ